MKILHLIPSFGPGGAERQLSILAPEFAKAGVECHVGYCYGGPNLQGLARSNVHLHQLSTRGNHDPRLLWQIWSLIRTIKPDVVQTWLLQMDVLGGVSAILAGVPYILSERSSEKNYPAGWKTRLRIALGKRAACIVANSQGGRDYWQSQAAAMTIHLVRNCVSAQEGECGPEMQALRDRLKGFRTILYAGRFSHEKNVLVMIEALIRALKRFPSAHALLFGEGVFEADLQRKVKEAGLSERIHFGGFSSSLAGWMRLADVLVSTSWYEGTPSVVLEAAAMGCPLVISEIPAHREIFDDSSATFINPDSAGDFAAALVSVLQGASMAKMKADKAQAVVAAFSQEKIVDSYLSIYEQVACKE